MEDLWAITCYFNPIGYKRRLLNYLAFRRELTIPLVTVELAYSNDFDLRPDAADILIRLKGKDVLWQKERLLNLALARLPQHCDSVAWLDCDVVFKHDDWAERASRALERFPVLQPFQRVYEPSVDSWGRSTRLPPDAHLGYSLAHLLSLGIVTPEILQGNMRIQYRSNSGLAWVARRELLNGDGFYDACIMGSGNRAMLCGALGRPAHAIEYLQMTPIWAEHYEAWADRHSRSVRANTGCTDGAIIHLWHGDLKHRRYQERHREFRVYEYSPATDIALDDNGCWRWNSQKPEMHAYVADYFRSRREDGDKINRRWASFADGSPVSAFCGPSLVKAGQEKFHRASDYESVIHVLQIE